jgi:DNA polymerase
MDTDHWRGMRVSIDFETRSVADLRCVGVYRYAEDPTTDIVCMAWAIDEAEPQLWAWGQPFPRELQKAIMAGAHLCAWNAQFERVIWNLVAHQRYGWPATTREQWYCTAAEGAAMALPRALGECARVLKVAEQKEDPGHLFVLRMCRPRSTRGGQIVWWTDPDRLQKLYNYCLQDVRTERAIGHAVRRLGARERRVYLLDQKMNDYGVLVDAPLIRSMRMISERAVEEANGKLALATSGLVDKIAKPKQLKQWLDEQGVGVESTRKAVVRDLLAEDDLNPLVRHVLEIRQEAGRSSVAKLKRALDTRCKDGRVRGLLLYHGANTGRWAGKLLQPHNFARGDFDPRPYYPLLEQGLAAYDILNLMEAPLAVVTSALRGMFIAAPGRRLLVGDYAQIEARVLAWLAGQEDQLALFRQGESPYPPMAEAIFNLAPGSVTKKGTPDQYKMGKDTVLGCGYGMGWLKFRAQIIENEGHDVGAELAQRAVRTYRERMTAIVRLWRDLDAAALQAVREPGTVIAHRGCRFSRRGGYLWLVLPSGRPLAYAAPSIEMRRVPWHADGCVYDEDTETWTCVEHQRRESVMAWSVAQKTRKWSKRAMYGGLWTENIVQALARDLLADGMLRLDEAGYGLCLTIHDEIVAERKLGEGSLEEFTTLAETTAPWAEGCPVGFEVFETDRYRKE